MKLTVIGCGDAFGSGARLQTSFHVQTSTLQFLIDCGATTLIGLEREGIDPNQIPVIFISHLHGDHFSGLIWWMLHARHVSARTEALTIVGPEGIEDRVRAATEALFPGTKDINTEFQLSFLTFQRSQPLTVEGIQVTPYEVSHPSGATSYALRIEVNGKTIAFSGDTEWVETLLSAAENSDLFITECFAFDRDVRFHMNWRTISKNLGRLKTKKVMLTHMGPDMLTHSATINEPSVVLAHDGLVIDL